MVFGGCFNCKAVQKMSRSKVGERAQGPRVWVYSEPFTLLNECYQERIK